MLEEQIGDSSIGARQKEKIYLRIIKYLQLGPISEQVADLNIQLAQLYYELFKLVKETGDQYLSMVYINQAIEQNPLNWLYQYEMGLFIK